MKKNEEEYQGIHEEKEGRDSRSQLRRMALLAMFFSLLGILLFRSDVRRSISIHFERSPERIVQYRWSQSVGSMRKALIDDVDAFSSLLRRTIASSDRIDDFLDDYYGFFTGISFFGRAVGDLFSDGNPRIESKVRKMIQEHILFDFSYMVQSLGEELEATALEYETKWRDAVHDDLVGRLSQEEEEALIERFKVEAVSPVASIVCSGGQIAAWDLPEMIMAGVMGGAFGGGLAREAGSASMGRISGAIGGRIVSGVAASAVTKVIGGLVIGLVVDMIVQKLVRIGTESGLRDDIGRAMCDFSDELRGDLISSIDRMLKEVE